MNIRMAREEDAGALLQIYAPYVTDTAVTFEYAVPTEEEFKGRIAQILRRYPYLVAEEGGVILGYAYASPFNRRAAYDWSVETSIYVERETRGKGVGKALYSELEEVLKGQGILNLNACISYPNPGSIGFHEKLGYHKAGHFTKCGYKLGRWYDMIWMEKMIGEHRGEPSPVLPASEVRRGAPKECNVENYQLECQWNPGGGEKGAAGLDERGAARYPVPSGGQGSARAAR